MQQPPKHNSPESPFSPLEEAIIMIVVVTVTIMASFYIHDSGESIWCIIAKTVIADLGLGLIIGLEIVLLTPRKRHFNYVTRTQHQTHFTRKDKHKYGR